MSAIFDAIISLLQRIIPTTHQAGEPLTDATCSWCHLCNQPLGICLLWWCAILLIVLIILVSCLGKKRKCPVCGEKNKRKAQRCIECGASLQKATEIDGQQQPDFWSGRRTPADQQTEQTPPTQQPTPLESPEQPAAGAKRCPYCGAILPERALFCGTCGRQLTPVSQTDKR